MIGAIYGDIVGSVYEFDNVKTKDFELICEDSGFTDDTVMTLAVARALARYDEAVKDPDRAKARNGRGEQWCPMREMKDLFGSFLVTEMHRLGEAYPRAGYGGRFWVWLTTKSTEPYGSFGNGSAMRVSPVAWYAHSLSEAIDLAKASAEVTHDHPEGIKGAAVTAGAIYLARTGATMEKIHSFVAKYYQMDFTLDEIRPTYSFNETCQGSVPQAMQAFFESESFEDAIRNAVSIGGDSDTIAAIAGSVAEAYYGVGEEEARVVAEKLDPPLLMILDDFLKRFVW